jgi:hypothetical protein
VAGPVRCQGCGRFRPFHLAAYGVSPPCPHCGGTAAVAGPTGSLPITMIGRVSGALHPGDQRQNWERRWQDIQDEAGELLAPVIGTKSDDAIQALRRRLGLFYVNAYHLKDDLKQVSAAIGITGTAIENAIDGDPDLALLADLANLIKHRRLTRRLHSGHAPRIVDWSGTDSPTGHGWRLSLTIDHNGRQLDGLDVAQRALDAWQRTLRNWHLI